MDNFKGEKYLAPLPINMCECGLVGHFGAVPSSH